MTATVEVAGVELSKKPRVPKYMGAEYVYGDGPAEGGALGCCLAFFAVIVFILSLCLLGSINWYTSRLCTYCTRCTITYCYASSCCYYNSWLQTWPISVDMLPFNNASQDSHIGNGDGSPDNWSLIVACVCGAVGGFFSCMCVAPSAMRRGGPAALVGSGILIAFGCHIASITALSVQFFSKKDEQWVYNAFCGLGDDVSCTENYVLIHDQSLIDYWINDYHYQYYAGLVYWVFSTTIILAFFELIFIIVAMCADEKYSGTRRAYAEDSGWGW